MFTICEQEHRTARSVRRSVTRLSSFLLACSVLFLAAVRANAAVEHLRITVLSTNIAERGIGEWGFSALVEADGHRLLFDTGFHADTVARNADDLKIDWTDVDTVVLSHHHVDHVSGLLTLRQKVIASGHSDSLSRVHVVRGAFWSRGPGPYEGDENPLIAIRPKYEATGGTFIEHSEPAELWPGVWLLGPIPRTRNEQNPVGDDHVHLPDGSFIPDPVPDDTALAINTRRGLVVLTGCGHAGLINTIEQAQKIVSREVPVFAVAGGFHLARASDASLEWTAGELKRLGVQVIHGGHCTGLETIYRLRERLGLPRNAVCAASVGSWLDLEEGIHPLSLAH